MDPRALPFSTVLLLAPLAPPADGDQLVRTGGILGDIVRYQVFADPGDLVVLMPSFSAGPTPIAFLDPLDPRLVDVGLDLIDLWTLTPTNPVGFVDVVYPLPNDAALAGFALHAQFVTIPLPLGSPVVDEISNATTFVLAHSGYVFATQNDNIDEIGTAGLAVLDDGRVLLAGGAFPTASDPEPVDDLVVFDPQTQTFQSLATQLPTPRALHEACKLNDGRVALIGGTDGNGILDTIDIYDPVTDAVLQGPSMNEPRIFHTATVLQDGRVFVCGGIRDYDSGAPLNSLTSALDSTEIYDPASNTWSAGPTLPKARLWHAASRLGDGRVLVTGGFEVVLLFGVPIVDNSNGALLYDGGANSLQAAASFPGPRSLHQQVTLPDGDALIAGGVDGTILTLMLSPLGSCVRYDAQTDTWTSVASMNVPRGFYFRLIDTGDELVAVGGVSLLDLSTLSGSPVSAIEVADPNVLAWSHVADLAPSAPNLFTSAIAFDGGERVLILGGDNDPLPVKDASAEIFHP